MTELGIPIADLSPPTRAGLEKLLFPRQAENPVDFGGRRVPEDVEITADVSRLLFEDPGVAYGLAVLTSMPFFAHRVRQIGERALAADKPVMITLTPGAAANAPLEDVGYGVFRM